MKCYNFADLVNIMRKLRSSEGCPWDREQTHRSLIPYLIEEVYEFVDAVDTNDYDNMKEELGDLLLQVVFHSQLAEEEGKFSINDVVDLICRKLIFRHPHVFGNSNARDASEVVKQWRSLKKLEGKERKSILDGIPRAIPPLEKALKIQSRVSEVGFDWKDANEVMNKVYEEIEEVKESLKLDDKARIEEELGDLFFTIVNLCRKAGIDPFMALSKANAKFEHRFRELEENVRRSGKSLENMGVDELEELWEMQKRGGN